MTSSTTNFGKILALSIMIPILASSRTLSNGRTGRLEDDKPRKEKLLSKILSTSNISYVDGLIFKNLGDRDGQRLLAENMLT